MRTKLSPAIPALIAGRTNREPRATMFHAWVSPTLGSSCTRCSRRCGERRSRLGASRRAGVVPLQVWFRHRAADCRLARHPRRRPHPDLRAHWFRQNSRRVFSLHRQAPPRRDRRPSLAADARRLHLAAQGALQRCPEEPRRTARRDPAARHAARLSLPRNPHRRPHR